MGASSCAGAVGQINEGAGCGGRVWGCRWRVMIESGVEGGES